jgi:hypothetical protein
MKTIIAVLLFLFFGAHAGAQDTTLTYEEMPGDSLVSWMKTRVENARRNIRETVEMPMVVRSTGWGCQCPLHYIGISPLVGDGPWIAPKAPKGFPVSNSQGSSLVVTGYFTGKWITEDLRNKDGEPAEWLYKMPEFKVLTWKKNELDYQVPIPHVVKTVSTKKNK